MSEYMEFFKAGHTGKTEVYDVLSKSSQAILGHIKWYGPWRQYCFFPSPACVFNAGCLNDIILFSKGLMEARKRIKGKPVKGCTDDHAKDDERTCRVCGCTQDHACEGGCSWVEEDLCSACQ